MKAIVCLAIFLMGATTPVLDAAEPNASGGVFQDCADCPQLVVIPAGSFLMGTAREYQIETEVPAELSPVEIRIGRSFAIGRFEITRAEYARFAKATGRDKKLVRCRTWIEEKQAFRDLQITWDAANVPVMPLPRHPASCVDWHDASAYVEWLSNSTGKRYRLPSEAEWEYVAKAGTRTLRPWGNDPDKGCEEANANDLSTRRRYPLGWGQVNCDDGFADVAPVGSLRPNAFGVYDMLGNVWEWTEDCSSLDYRGRPTDARAWVWEGGCRRRIQRGGGWSTGPERTRPGFHGDGSADDRADFAGFRVVRELGVPVLAHARAKPDDSSPEASLPRPRESLPMIEAKPVRVRDCADCPELLQLPAGEFTLGSSADEYEHDPSSGETPALHVRIRRGFALAVREVTAGEFRGFLAASKYQPRFACAAQGTDQEPARCVTPQDAEQYLAWLSARTGKRFRLASESEWEYALRAGTTTARFWSGRDSHEGVSISRACDFANVKDVSGRDIDSAGPWARCRDGFAGFAPVGSFAENPWGFFDLAGNARELTADCFTPSYKGRPADERPWRWADCSLRVVRGGSFKSRPFDARSAARDAISIEAPESAWADVGFRVARD